MPLVESNKLDTAAPALKQYLKPLLKNKIDTLVLACTHYPLIKNEIDSFYKQKVKIFDSAEVVAAKLKWVLEKEGLNSEMKTAEDQFYVSDFTESFERTTKIFYGHQIQLQRCNIWKND